MVLCDDDALLIGAGDDFYVDTPAGSRPGVMVQCVLDCGEDGQIFIAWVGMRGGGIDADVDVLCVDESCDENGGKEKL